MSTAYRLLYLNHSTNDIDPKQCTAFAVAEDFMLGYKKQNNKKGNTKKGSDHSQNLQGICVRLKTDIRF